MNQWRNPLLLSLAGIVLYPLVKPLGWLWGSLLMLILLIFIVWLSNKKAST